MFDPQPITERHVNLDSFDGVKQDLGKAGFKCGWLLQITPVSRATPQEQYIQFPLTKEQQEAACSIVLKTLAMSDEAALELEQQTRDQSESRLWYDSHTGRIALSNFG